MPLPQILYPPPTEHGIEEWMNAHALHHVAIIDALSASRGLTLPKRVLYPVDTTNLKDWLQRHQDTHDEMTAALGVAGSDLTGLDLKNKGGADNWFFEHFLQHQAVAQLCGFPV